jgi:hypothetical protein
MIYKIFIEVFARCSCFGIFTLSNGAQMVLPLKRDRRVLSRAKFWHRVWSKNPSGAWDMAKSVKGIFDSTTSFITRVLYGTNKKYTNLCRSHNLNFKGVRHKSRIGKYLFLSISLARTSDPFFLHIPRYILVVHSCVQCTPSLLL